MNKVFDGVDFKRVVKPGGIYILSACGIEEPVKICTIRTNEEVIDAINALMALSSSFGGWFGKYIGIKKLNERCQNEENYLIMLLCSNKHTGKFSVLRFRLERIRAFEELFERADTNFPF